MFSLCPNAIPGSDGSPAPIAFHPGPTRCTVLRRDGSCTGRCGSLARIGLAADGHAAVHHPIIATVFAETGGPDGLVVDPKNAVVNIGGVETVRNLQRHE